MEVKGKKVYVGLSGGVDSAVSAALLKEAGAEVVGVFIKGWYPPGMPCTWAEDRRDAMRTAAQLQIPFATLDAGAEYKRAVIDYLIAEYRAGRTPNPDVMCNRDVKFGAFYRFAMDCGADLIATGHYLSGEKDQRYFLWAVPKEILAKTVFPVGHLEKTEVRRLAGRFRLPVADKKDSQGVCFLGPVSIKEFLEHELGSGDPTLLHTIGERVNGAYVIAKKDGKLITAPDRGETLRIPFHDANWHVEPTGQIAAQYRYRGPRVPGKVEGNSFIPAQPIPERIAPGQSVVFYRGEALAGGGIIA